MTGWLHDVFHRPESSRELDGLRSEHAELKSRHDQLRSEYRSRLRAYSIGEYPDRAIDEALVRDKHQLNRMRRRLSEIEQRIAQITKRGT